MSKPRTSSSKENQNMQPRTRNPRPPLAQVDTQAILNFLQIEKRQSGEYFKFDFKRQISDRVAFLNQENDDDTKTENFKMQYKVGHRIGQGAYAAVRIGLQIATNRKVAIKIYEKAKITEPNRRKGVKREIELLERLNHKNIVKIIDTVESNNHVNIIMEYVSGSSLHSLLKKHNERRLPEAEARPLFQQCLLAVQYCHSKNIAHRDIKLENILLEGTTPKLIDFGFSTSFTIDKKVKMFCGTPSYMAPEIVTRQEYRGDKADIWALGVVLFTLLQGYFPFKGATDSELYAKIQTGELVFQHPISYDAKNLITQMLHIDQDHRPLTGQLLKHKWFCIRVPSEPISNEAKIKHKLPQDLLEDLNAITKNMSYITPTNNQKHFQFEFSQTKKQPFNVKAVTPKQQFFTTTNAQVQMREPQFFKVERTINRTLSKERQSSFSFESSRGLSQKKPHQLTVHPSFVPSEKSFGSNAKSPAHSNEKKSFNFFYN